MDDSDGAIQYAMEALKVDPLNLDARRISAMENASVAGRLCSDGEAALLETRLTTPEANQKSASGTDPTDEEAALELFEAAIKQDETFARAYHLVGNILESWGCFEEAIDAQRLAIRFACDDRNRIAEKRFCVGQVASAESHLALAVVLEAQRRQREAVNHYNEALHLLPYESALQTDAELCLADALTLSTIVGRRHSVPMSIEESDEEILDRAEGVYTSVAGVSSITSERAHAAYGLGSVHRWRGINLGNAVALLRTATTLEPANARYWHALGCATESLAVRTASGRVSRSSFDE